MDFRVVHLPRFQTPPLPLLLCVSFNSLLDTERQISSTVSQQPLSFFILRTHSAYNPFLSVPRTLKAAQVYGLGFFQILFLPPSSGLFPFPPHTLFLVTCATFIVSVSVAPSVACCSFLCRALYFVFKASFSARYVPWDLSQLPWRYFYFFRKEVS